MLTEKNFLFYEWQHTLQSFEVEKASAEQVFTNLIQAYSNPSRHYHTLKHISSVFHTIQSLQAYTQDLAAVQLATWFHDIIYDTQAQDNEEKSAEYACESLSSLGIPLSCLTKVKRLILNTKHHQADDDIDSQVLLDADLAILATNPVDYQEYAHAIRQEYAWMSDSDYIQGRTQVLERFLQRQRIYCTPLIYDKSEQSARANLQAEIQRLNK
ncbi:HD domain-containing protein [Anabaena subtropica]|uniref:Metal-dependent HD superfamily phosphohydrolase n=1 Tax=Anabaena subtropica FACHB-260 TaxID=2692884 RepID=A0ABR8CRT5_9NOST|nr:hypothetical protein [Anabaena subtropica]MBD2344892.1 hypothetical protein [Anabaena subtropica FACHB-260]